LIEAGNRFYFEADIINFFGEVDRDTLWRMFSRKVRQRSLLPLLQQCFKVELENLESYKPEFQELFIGAGSGIPQGGVLSPMLANFYLHEFDRRMMQHCFNLVRYADDFVVLCDSEKQARQAHDFAKVALATLNLRIHDLGLPDSKSRIGYFPKDGLTFLGVRFEGREIFPTSKVVQRFKLKVEEVLKPESGLSLFKTLQRLRNLIDGWGKCYRAMRVYKLYLELDVFIKTSLEQYLEHLGIRLIGTKKGKQMKLLGVPSLVAMVEFSKSRE
jgi:RNA-directed DNA polymerase